MVRFYFVVVNNTHTQHHNTGFCKKILWLVCKYTCWKKDSDQSYAISTFKVKECAEKFAFKKLSTLNFPYREINKDIRQKDIKYPSVI